MKYIKRKVRNIKSYFNYHWDWIRILSSPFVGIKLKWHFGNVHHGVPYKLPSNDWFKFDFVSLGWKTKYDDFRHEWNPMISIVLLKKQLIVWVSSKTDCEAQYWETWLNYRYKTNKNNSEEDRVKELIIKYPQIWSRYNKEEDKYDPINYLYDILKPKYKKMIDENEPETDDTY